MTYQAALDNLPRDGCGRHNYMLTIANIASRAGIPTDKVYSDIRDVLTDGRHITDREIHSALSKAYNESVSFTPRLPVKPVVRDGRKALERIISQSDFEEVDVWESSPIRIDIEPKDHSILFLETMFQADDLIFIGNQYDEGIPGKTIRAAAEWLNYFRQGGKTAPYIIINPLSGQAAPSKAGGETFRGDSNVISFRHCLVEFDNISLDNQYKFWSAAKLPIKTLVFTGGKSVHAWLDLSSLASITGLDTWNYRIKDRLYKRLLEPLGVDKACSNPARLSRLPGHYRAEKAEFQRIIYLSKEGQSIC